MNGSDAPLASTVNKTTWSCYLTLDSLISSPVLAGRASKALMLPPCVYRHYYKVRGILNRIKITPYISAPQSPPGCYTIAWIRRTLRVDETSVT